MFREALEAIRNNQRVRARDLLTRLLRVDKENAEYWLWLSSVVETDKERVFCLKSVLRLDPDNQAAQRGLRLMGELADGDEVAPAPLQRRKWDIDLGEEEQITGFRKVLANPVLRLLVFSGAGIIVLGLILVGVFGPKGTLFGPRLTITPIAWSATPSETPTETPIGGAVTATPLITSTPAPLWMQLESTYTPRPPYVNTPHPRSEAYQVAIRALARGDYESLLTFMEQVQRENPEAPDPYYYMGEAYRVQENYERAIWAYENAIELDPNFAPAYIGRALTRKEMGEDVDLAADLEKAIALAPDFGDAYLALAAQQLDSNEPEEALNTLERATNLLADHPRFYLLRARAYLALGQNEAALTDALQAYQLDITDLPVYLVLGEAHLKNNQPEEALGYIRTYGLYQQDQPMYWAMLGWALYETGEEYHAAMDALDQALALEEESGLALQYRGLTALEIGEPKQALNDLYLARTLLPNSFELSFGMARAFWADGNTDDAYAQVNASEDLAETDEQFGQLYYYRAQIAHELSQFHQEKLDWRALLDLPAGAAPEEWRAEADLRLNPPTATTMPTATATSTPSATATKTLTPSSTATATKSPTATATRTPSLTVTP